VTIAGADTYKTGSSTTSRSTESLTSSGRYHGFLANALVG